MPDSAAAAVVCRGLEKRYGGVTALAGLDLEVPTGSVFGFLGPNGAGKTTTLRILTSLAAADGGEAQVAGLPVRDGAATRRGLIGYLDQDPRFHGWMTGRELLELVGRLHGVRDGELRNRVDDALELVGLTDAARRSIGGYSGGMRQRLGLAQAVINRPPLLLLDEPVSSLDPEGRRDVLHVIRSLAADSTVVLSTHILSDVERVCDRVGIIDRGRMITEGPIDDLLDRYAQPVYRIEADPGDESALAALAERLRGEPWVDGVDTEHAGTLRVSVSDASESGRRLLAEIAAARISVASFERQRPSLEDVFLRLIGEARA
jgi:ABC-2 type transport system ATP-binding protein